MKGDTINEYNAVITNALIPIDEVPAVTVFQSEEYPDTIEVTIIGYAGDCEWLQLTHGQVEQLISSLQTALQRAQGS